MSTKIPKIIPTLDLAAGDFKAGLAGLAAEKLFQVALDKVRTLPDFNVRVESPDYREHIESLTESIRVNGFDKSKPLAGFVGKDGEDDVVYLIDGHSRLSAAQSLELPHVPIVVRKDPPSVQEATIALHTNNSGRPLTPLELGIVVKRLKATTELSMAEIASHLAITPRWASEVLMLAEAPAKVRQFVADGAVSATKAMTLLRKDPKAAVATMGDMAKGTKPVRKPKTPKIESYESVFDAGSDMKALVTAAAAAIRERMTAEDGGSIAGRFTIVFHADVPPAKAEDDDLTAAPPAKPKRTRKKVAEVTPEVPAADEDEDPLTADTAEPAPLADEPLDLPPPPPVPTVDGADDI